MIENLIKQRIAHRFSQRIFALACRIPSERYAKIEQGEIELTQLELKAIQRVLENNPPDRDFHEKIYIISDAEKKLMKWNDDIRAMKGTP